MRRKFSLDKGNGLFLGVCAGIARYFRIDPTIVRIAAVVATIIGAAPWTFILYGLIAWFARNRTPGVDVGESYVASRGSTRQVDSEMRDIDRRLAEVETYVTSPNNRLAREIEELR